MTHFASLAARFGSPRTARLPGTRADPCTPGWRNPSKYSSAPLTGCPSAASTSGCHRPTTSNGCSGSPASSRWRRSSQGSWSLATNSRKRATTCRCQARLGRHVYEVEISGGSSAAHYLSDYVGDAGIKLPTRHRIFPRTPDGQPLAELLIVSIDLSDIAFT